METKLRKIQEILSRNKTIPQSINYQLRGTSKHGLVLILVQAERAPRTPHNQILNSLITEPRRTLPPVQNWVGKSVVTLNGRYVTDCKPRASCAVKTTEAIMSLRKEG